MRDERAIEAFSKFLKRNLIKVVDYKKPASLRIWIFNNERVFIQIKDDKKVFVIGKLDFTPGFIMQLFKERALIEQIVVSISQSKWYLERNVDWQLTDLELRITVK